MAPCKRKLPPTASAPPPSNDSMLKISAPSQDAPDIRVATTIVQRSHLFGLRIIFNFKRSPPPPDESEYIPSVGKAAMTYAGRWLRHLILQLEGFAGRVSAEIEDPANPQFQKGA